MSQLQVHIFLGGTPHKICVQCPEIYPPRSLRIPVTLAWGRLAPVGTESRCTSRHEKHTFQDRKARTLTFPFRQRSPVDIIHSSRNWCILKIFHARILYNLQILSAPHVSLQRMECTSHSLRHYIHLVCKIDNAQSQCYCLSNAQEDIPSTREKLPILHVFQEHNLCMRSGQRKMTSLLDNPCNGHYQDPQRICRQHIQCTYLTHCA